MAEHKESMEQKHALWPAILIILLVAAGAIYFALQLAPEKQAPTPAAPAAQKFDTAELDREESIIDADLAGVEDELRDYNNVDPAQDKSGI